MALGRPRGGGARGRGRGSARGGRGDRDSRGPRRTRDDNDDSGDDEAFDMNAAPDGFGTGSFSAGLDVSSESDDGSGAESDSDAADASADTDSAPREPPRGKRATAPVRASRAPARGSDDEDGVDDAVIVNRAKRAKGKSGGFQSMGLSYPIYKAVIKKGYKVPTPIQRKAIPLLMDGKDIVAMARTGSGKTAAFLLPMLEKLKARQPGAGVRALVMSPTRELAMQTLKFAKELAKFTDLRCALIVGGDGMDAQFAAMHEGPDIVVATPGRFLHVAVEMDLKFPNVSYVVFDEADRLFELGLEEQLREILARLPEERQTCLFSATLPRLLVDFARVGLHDPALVRLDVDTKISENLKLAYLSVRKDEKPAALVHLVTRVIGVKPMTPEERRMKAEEEKEAAKRGKKRGKKGDKKKDDSADASKDGEGGEGTADGKADPRSKSGIDAGGGSTIVFASTRHHVEFLCDLLSHAGIDASYVYGNLDQTARKINLAKFRTGRTKVLVVTDVAARGIDIPLLDNVVNYDFPPKPKLFVHRVGRAARAGRSGTAYSLLTPDELPFALDLHLFLAKPLVLAGTGGDQTDDCVMGLFPTGVMEDDLEFVRQTVETSSDLVALSRVVENAHKMYLKSRPLPSAESVKRAKEILAEGRMVAHPVFAGRAGADQRHLDVLSGVRNYRPSQTIFEIDRSNKDAAAVVMRGKRASDARSIARRQEDLRAREEAERRAAAEAYASGSDEDGAVAMDMDGAAEGSGKKRKRAVAATEDEIDNAFEAANSKAKRARTAPAPSAAGDDDDAPGTRGIRDEEHFIRYKPADHNAEKALSVRERGSGGGFESFRTAADTAVLDMAGDDGETIKRGRNQLKWDRKKKKYIRESDYDQGPAKKKIRTESGAYIPATYKTNKYKEWKEKNRVAGLPSGVAPAAGVVSFENDDGGGAEGEGKGRKGHKAPKGKGSPGGRSAKGDGTGPKKGGAHANAQSPGKAKKGPRSELKSREQILKMRRRKDAQSRRIREKHRRQAIRGKGKKK